MQRAVAAGDGAMAAIMGLGIDKIEAIIEASEDGVVALANDNSDGQAVLSGAAAAVEAAAGRAKESGAKRALMLDVSAPFHCPLMQPAAEELAPALSAIDWQQPALPVIANVTAQANQRADAIADLLCRQVTGRVRWRESMALMAEMGVDRMIEFGAGKVLTGLARRTLKGAELVNIQTPDDVDALVAAL
jgi:[acyl-carrier-protein] S-malonyltransferase